MANVTASRRHRRRARARSPLAHLNPVSNKATAFIVGGVAVAAALVAGIVYYEKKKAPAQAPQVTGGNTPPNQLPPNPSPAPQPGVAPKTINVSYLSGIPGSQTTIHANAGDTVILALPGAPGTILAGLGSWVDQSTGGVAVQSQQAGSGGVPWQMTYNISGSGTLAVGNSVGGAAALQWYALTVTVP